jgi:tRNA nucleotidyltransferase (CCA-adding enzyme)
LRRLGVFDGPPPPMLLGRHLLEMGMKPGPLIGKIVERVYFLQLSGEIHSLEEAKAHALAIKAAFEESEK